MKIKGINGMTIPEIQEEVASGGKFVQYTYCLSAIFISLRQPSAIYFIRRNGNAFLKGLPFSLLSFVFGWWGIPWGVFYTAQCLYTNFGGGKDRTDDMMNILHRHTNGHVFEFEKSGVLASTN